jgi:hypothetical protein
MIMTYRDDVLVAEMEFIEGDRDEALRMLRKVIRSYPVSFLIFNVRNFRSLIISGDYWKGLAVLAGVRKVAQPIEQEGR